MPITGEGHRHAALFIAGVLPIGVTLVMLSVEACRRTISWGLTSVVVILISYVAFGHQLEGDLDYDKIDLPYFLTRQRRLPRLPTS